MRDLGFYAQVVERTIPYKFIKVDLYNWIDIVGVHPTGQGVLGVQVTSGSNLSARLKKAKDNPALIAWLLCGGKLQAHGWRKLKGRWSADVRDITMEHLT